MGEFQQAWPISDAVMEMADTRHMLLVIGAW